MQKNTLLLVVLFLLVIPLVHTQITDKKEPKEKPQQPQQQVIIPRWTETKVTYKIDEVYPIEYYNESCFKTLIPNGTKLVAVYETLKQEDKNIFLSSKLPYYEKGVKTNVSFAKENILCHNRLVGIYKWGFNSSQVEVANFSVGIYNYTDYDSDSGIYTGMLEPLGGISSTTLPDSTENIEAIQVVGDIAYLSVYSDDSLILVNVSDPTNPIVVGNYTSSALPYSIDASWEVQIVGDVAYMTSYFDSSLTSINISNVTNPFGIGNYTSSSLPYSLSLARGLYVLDNKAYVGSVGHNTLVIVNVTNPQKLNPIGNYTKATKPYSVSSIKGIYVVGDIAYIVSTGNDEFTLLNISNHSDIVPVGNYSLDNPQDIIVDNNIAYIISSTSDCLYLFNVSNSTDPNIINEYCSTTKPYSIEDPREISLDNGIIAIGSYEDDSITLLDVSDPYNLITVSHYTEISGQYSIEGAESIYIKDNLVYVGAHSDDTFVILNISKYNNGTYTSEVYAINYSYSTVNLTLNTKSLGDTLVEGSVRTNTVNTRDNELYNYANMLGGSVQDFNNHENVNTQFGSISSGDSFSFDEDGLQLYFEDDGQNRGYCYKTVNTVNCTSGCTAIAKFSVRSTAVIRMDVLGRDDGTGSGPNIRVEGFAIRGYLSDSGGKGIAGAGNGMNVDQFYTVAVRLNQSGCGDDCEYADIWIDGKLNASINNVDWHSRRVYPIYIGCGDASSNNAFNGTIAWTAYFNRTLNNTEIAEWTNGTYDFTDYQDYQSYSNGADTKNFTSDTMGDANFIQYKLEVPANSTDTAIVYQSGTSLILWNMSLEAPPPPEFTSCQDGHTTNCTFPNSFSIDKEINLSCLCNISTVSWARNISFVGIGEINVSSTISFYNISPLTDGSIGWISTNAYMNQTH